jgi:hypothetical protein
VQRAWIFGRTAVLVFPWWEPDPDGPEQGVRIELRLLRPLSYRGSPSAAQEISIDQPVWRVDLFDRIADGPRTFASAHFHPHFHGVEPSDRHWDPDLAAEPLAWLTARLTELGAILPTTPADDVEALRGCAAEIVAAARSVLEEIWTHPSSR